MTQEVVVDNQAYNPREVCRIGIHWIAQGVVDVGAPMKYKDICYEMLRDAAIVIERSPPHVFALGVTAFSIVMDMSGRVDVSAPLPPKPLALAWLKDARNVIERYNDDSAPAMRPFNAAVMAE